LNLNIKNILKVVIIMTEKQIQFLELDSYINDNIDKLTKEEYKRLVEELNVLVYEILND
jgi:hypothetical protein